MLIKSEVINGMELRLFGSGNPQDILGPFYVVKKYPRRPPKASRLGFGSHPPEKHLSQKANGRDSVKKPTSRHRKRLCDCFARWFAPMLSKVRFGRLVRFRLARGSEAI